MATQLKNHVISLFKYVQYVIYEFYINKAVIFINVYTFLWQGAEEEIRDKVAWGGI